MLVIKRIALILFACWITQSHSQSNAEVIGNPTAVVLDLRVDEDRGFIIAATREELQVWNYESKTLLKSWPASGILAIDVKNSTIAGVSKTGKLYIWDVETGREMHQQQVSPSALLCVTWIDSARVAIGGDDGSIYKANVLTGQLTNHVKTDASITAIASGVGNVIIGNSKGELEIYHTFDFVQTRSLRAHKSWIRDVQVIDSTGSFVTVADDGRYKRWSPSMVNVSQARFNDWLTCVDFAGPRSSSVMAIGEVNGSVVVQTKFGEYRAKTNATVNQIVLLKKPLPKIKIIVATHGRGIQVWDGTKMKFKS